MVYLFSKMHYPFYIITGFKGQWRSQGALFYVIVWYTWSVACTLLRPPLIALVGARHSIQMGAAKSVGHTVHNEVDSNPWHPNLILTIPHPDFQIDSYTLQKMVVD